LQNISVVSQNLIVADSVTSQVCDETKVQVNDL